MESDSDGEGELEVTFSAMRQPPLIKQLRGILSEYPDGGQIIKELLQNAEDAGASEVKILFDSRTSNHKSSKLYNKFFQAPALCVYNNAVFTARDWAGIEMIYSSVKEEDRMKVGRFGLGFKSVFHITDYPCVVSGQYVLMIDPHQKDHGQVNAKVELNKLTRYKAFVETLCGTFGLDKQHLKDGYYPGTIFWFPVRQQASELSTTLYNKRKVDSLFEAFKAEASCILIFLKQLTRISLHKRSNGNDITEIEKTELVENAEQGLKERTCFKDKLLELQNDIPATPISSRSVLTVEVTDFKASNLKQVYQWLVVNYFMGKNASPSFKKLINNDKLGLVPYVGVAAPLGGVSHSFVGHVFCFLPLPKEGSRLTGLPFHVNGFFSLSQNRHHLKWATDEQDIEKVDDITIQWNRKLITECLPLAYERLLQYFIDYSVQHGNSHVTVQSVYNAIPNPSMISDDKWKCFLEQLFSRIQNMPILYRTEWLNAQRCEWIPVNRARFATLTELPRALSHIKPAVIKALFLLEKEYVDVTDQTFQKLNQMFTILDLTPDILSSLLKRDNVYTSMTNEEKMNLLQYLLSEYNYRNIEGLQLLPLASGAWAKFGRYADTVYMCTDEQMRLLPGIENKLLPPRSKLPTLLLTTLEDITQREGFQLRSLDVSKMSSLICEVLSLHLGSRYPMCITSTCGLTISWVQYVWTYFRAKAGIAIIAAIPLFPIIKKGMWPFSSDSWELVELNDLLILKQMEGIHLPENVCKCLDAFHVKIVPTVPDWISKMEMKGYIYMPSSSSVMDLLSRIASLPNWQSTVRSFNEQVSDECRRALQQFIGNCVVSDINTKTFLQSLKMFEEVKSTMYSRGFVSLNDNSSFVGDKCWLIPYPVRYIDAKSCSATFLRSLGGREVQNHELVLTTIQAITRNQYTDDEKVKFMEYFVKQFSHFENDAEIVQRVKSVRFLKTTSGDKMISEVFNPYDETLRDLFEGEDRFPLQRQIPLKHLTIFQTLGLKGTKDITADTLLQTANVLDKWSVSGKQDAQMKKKSTAFMKYIKVHPEMLEHVCQSCQCLKSEMNTLECIRYESAPTGQFPLPWNSQRHILCSPEEARDMKMYRLVGCTMPLVKSNEELSNAFGWYSEPPINKVLTQLVLVKKNYEVENTPELLPIIKCIYLHLNKRRSENMKDIASQGLVWVGNGFFYPKQTVIHHCDLDLCPYVYNIPNEFSNLENLFQSLGCYVDQTVDVLLETLDAIRKFHTSTRQPAEIKRDMRLTFNILEKLALTPGEIKGKEARVYIPIHTGNHELVMKAMAECIFDLNRRYYKIEDCEETVYFIHESIRPEVVEKLGIKSWSAKTLSATEELQFDEWGQDEPLTARIKTLLKEGYKDGLSVPKELIQNADDAGATEIKFLYDERENNDMKEHVFSTDMKECQGPALWVYNNSRFTDADLANITKLNGATKATESHTIGKFGLGFCSVYNLTDVPSFISGNNIVMFDPHKVYLPNKCSGMKIDLSKEQNRYLLRQHKDQFKHFEGIFGCKLPGPDFREFNGTLFRFPLRTQEQAHLSQIKSKAYSKDKMHLLLSMFMKAAGNMFLFTQNLKSIEIYHLPRNSNLPTKYGMLFKMTRDDVSQKKIKNAPTVLRDVEQRAKEGMGFSKVQQIKITLTLYKRAEKLLQECNIKTTTVTSSWLISWATGTKDALKIAKRMSLKGVLPLASVGVPVLNYETLTPVPISEAGFGFYTSSHLYCFLPLPLQTSLQVHINGCFDITSDRRQLLSITEDDMGSDGALWNDALMKDSLVTAFVQLLAALAYKQSPAYVYHSLWPITHERVLLPFQDSFYLYILNTNDKVFQTRDEWVSFKNVLFLDPKLRNNDVIGDAALETLLKFPSRTGKHIAEMPVVVLSAFEESIGSELIRQQIVFEEELFSAVFENINHPYWISKTNRRNDMILFALSSSSDVIKDIIRTTECIPCEPNGVLRKPTDLVDPSCTLARMFRNSDGVFPKESARFQSSDILACLRELGMRSDSLTTSMLINRCKSIETEASHCCDCAYDRCNHILQYLSSSSVYDSLVEDDQTLTAVKDVLFLPALSRPSGWVFPWHSDTNSSLKEFTSTNECTRHRKKGKHTAQFGLANQLLRDSAKQYVGCVLSILDESVYSKPNSFSRSRSVWKLLRIEGYCKERLPVTKIIEQVSLLSHVYLADHKFFKELKQFLDASFDLISSLIQTGPKENHVDLINSVGMLSDKEVIIVGKELVAPTHVAYHFDGECSPDIYQLPDTEAHLREEMYDAMGVVDHFTTDRLLEVLKNKKDKWQNKPCLEIKAVHCLLTNLATSMERDYVSLRELDPGAIVAPDKGSILTPTFELVVENDDSFKTSLSMKCVHDSISHELAEAIGVRLKERKCLEQISFGIPFGQKEKLVNRLRKLLNAYPCDGSIMKELLQNADDAKANEIHFIKDYRTNVPQGKTFGGQFDDLQGPALCVFNNSSFTMGDLEGIQNLGEGSKSDDPTMTGQYGVGFNAVYHLSDAPSFMSKGPNLGNGGTLCIFDPLCKYIPDVTKEEPGRRYDVDGLKESFPGVLTGYLERQGFFRSGTGTMFRFPLRQSGSDISDEKFSPESLDQLLSSLHVDMFEALLFLKHVNCIRVSDVTSGEMKEEYWVHAVLSDHDAKRRNIFFDVVDKLVKGNPEDKAAKLSTRQLQVGYKMIIEDSKGRSDKWYVHQTFGFGEGITFCDTVIDAVRDGQLGLLPLGGVALPLPDFNCERNYKKQSHGKTNQFQQTVIGNIAKYIECAKTKIGKAFCFLPLPIHTGLPVHVNGHFALDHEARRSLWNGGYRQKWNELVIDEAIIPSWINSLRYVQSEFVSNQLHHVQKWQSMNMLMDMYHTLFPIVLNTSDEIWKRLSKLFYRKVTMQRIALFPVVNDCQSNANVCSFAITWTPLGLTVHPFDGVFNILFEYNWYQSKDCFKFGRRLKELGVNLIETPKEIRKTIESSEIENVSVSSPEFLVSYLKSFEGSIVFGAFELGAAINSPLETTKIKDIPTLKMVIRFLQQGDTFVKMAEGLPIILTADGILRKYSTQDKVYIFQYTHLLPESRHLLLHEELLPLYSYIGGNDTNATKKMTVDNLESLLPDSYNVDVYSGTETTLWDREHGNPLSEKWISDLFLFLYEEAQELVDHKLYSGSTYTNIDKFKSYMKQLGTWKFLPTTNFGLSHLYPMSYYSRILHTTCFNDPCLQASLEKLRLPTIDESVFKTCEQSQLYKQSFYIRSAIQKCVASVDNPYELLKCLTNYTSNIVSCELSSAEGTALLSFFAKHIEKFLEIDGVAVYDYLRKLPLFVTQQNNLVDLQCHANELIVPTGMPTNGIEQWGTATGVLLLLKQSDDVLAQLYKRLNLTEVAIEIVYAEWLLPKFDRLPREHWLEHIVFVRDNVLPHSFSDYTGAQQKILRLLKRIPFVPVGASMKRVNELYSPHHPVFRCMLSENCFLPKDFLEHKWEAFLSELGYIEEPDDEMILSYAREIEREAARGIDDVTIKKKSKAVSKYFLSVETWKEQTISDIRTVRFVMPYRVHENLSTICPQHEESRYLICFHGSTFARNEALCWTTVNMIPNDKHRADLNMKLRLGVCEDLNIADVTKHCQNICDKLNSTLETSQELGEFVETLMEEIYSFFNKHKHLDEDIKRRLKHTPIVYIPDEKLMVNATDVVIELSEKEEIKPYLFKAPAFYGKYREVFTEFGSEKCVNWMHYVGVLDKMKTEQGNNPMFKSEMDKMRRALENLVRTLRRQNKKNAISTDINQIRKLYLPNKSTILQDATALVVSDNLELEKRLSGRVLLDFFIGFKSLKIQIFSSKEVIKLLPTQLQPKLLSDIVCEDVLLADIEQLTSRKARTIECFIHSHEFVEGILRLIIHQLNLESREIEEEKHIIPIRFNLQTATVVKVSGLKTVLRYNGETVDGTEKRKRCFVKHERNERNMCYTLYFQEEKASDTYDIGPIINEKGGLIDLINKCTMNLLEKDTIRYLPDILRLMNEPLQITTMLSQNDIEEYSLPDSNVSSLFPGPGTLVEKKFHPFLEQGIVPFRPHEYTYAALEIEDDLDVFDEILGDSSGECDSLPEPVYIYVHIVREIGERSDGSCLHIQYEIDAGRYDPDSVDSDSHIVSISRLYRFVRQKPETSTTVVSYDTEPVGTVPFDETCRRIRVTLIDAWKLPEVDDRKRIIKRLWLQWHPDRNHGNEKYCTRVFNYIQEIIKRLKNGEDVGIDEDVNDNTGQSAPNTSHSSNLNRRARAHASAYYANFDEYSQSSGTGRYSHTTEDVPNVGEARRWMRQAKNDYLAAAASMPSMEKVKGYNWVCYECHQACEKALKAAWLAKNANNLSIRRSHSLREIADGLSDALVDQADRIESRLRHHTRMRYPESAVTGLDIPSDIFNRDDAEYVLEITNELLDNVEQRIM